MSELILAPMEGLVDAVMRDTLTALGGIDRAVTEFVRVSECELPNRVFHRLCPELQQRGRTAAGVPVRVQLLGSDPALLAACARRAVQLGAPGIDLNFGCPAKTVNRSRGGAVLLREPELVEQIVRAVREAVPGAVPVSAKMRLGYEDTALALDNAVAIERGGADELCVHGRTKLQGYGGQADWGWIGRIRRALSIPVVANGDVRSVEDYYRCREVSGCDQVMLGRGLVARPDLALQIRRSLAGCAPQPLEWEALRPLLQPFFSAVCVRVSPRHAPGRLKQWLGMLKQSYPQAEQLFCQLRQEQTSERLQALLAAPLAPARAS